MTGNYLRKSVEEFLAITLRVRPRSYLARVWTGRARWSLPMCSSHPRERTRQPRNKGRIVGQKRP
jgi:hypothetical protein